MSGITTGWRRLTFLEAEVAAGMKASSFQQALESGDLQAIRAVPKADLHNHGFAAADREYRAVEVLELDEVQHGIAAAESPAVMRFLADHRIRLNICPTSNILLGRVKRLEEHPIRKLFDAAMIRQWGLQD